MQRNAEQVIGREAETAMLLSNLRGKSRRAWLPVSAHVNSAVRRFLVKSGRELQSQGENVVCLGLQSVPLLSCADKLHRYKTNHVLGNSLCGRNGNPRRRLDRL